MLVRYAKDEKAESCTVQSGFSDVSHCMLDSPNNTVDEELELLREKTK